MTDPLFKRSKNDGHRNCSSSRIASRSTPQTPWIPQGPKKMKQPLAHDSHIRKIEILLQCLVGNITTTKTRHKMVRKRHMPYLYFRRENAGVLALRCHNVRGVRNVLIHARIPQDAKSTCSRALWPDAENQAWEARDFDKALHCNRGFGGEHPEVLYALQLTV